MAFRCDMCGKCFRALDVRHPQYFGTAPMNQLTEVTRAQEGSGARKLRMREKCAEARVPMEIGDTSEEAVSINENST